MYIRQSPLGATSTIRDHQSVKKPSAILFKANFIIITIELQLLNRK